MNTPLRVLLVDDVELARQRLQRLLAGLPDVQVCASVGDVPAALAAIARESPDLVLLDIDMPEQDGFALLEQLPPDATPAIVFCTAHAQFAARAFAVQAVDYLLKPVEAERLRGAIERVQRRRHAGTAAPHYLLLREREQLRVLPTPAIDWIEAAGNYLCIRIGGETLVHRETLTRLLQRLDPARFLRIHRSRIVNLARIRQLLPLHNGDHRVVLDDGSELLLSRTYRDALLQALQALQRHG